MRIQFNNRTQSHGRRIHGGAVRKTTSNVEKLTKDFSRIYMSPKVKPQKKFVLNI